MPVIRLSGQQEAEAWFVDRDDEGVFTVRGDKIEKFARRTNFDNYEGVNRLRDIMKKLGITHELTRMGATGESLIIIEGHEFTLLE
jgi:GTP-binding protein